MDRVQGQDIMLTYIANNTQTYRQSSRPGYNVTYIAKKYTDL
jgi:hypothetical protein